MSLPSGARRSLGGTAWGEHRRSWRRWRALVASMVAGAALLSRADFATAAVPALPASATTTAAPTPATPAAQALAFDLDKAVRLRAQRGWMVDRYEVEALMPDALFSVCQVLPADRAAAGTLLRRALAAAGGPPATQWAAGLRDLDALDDAIRVARALALLEAASARANAGECPFQLVPNAQFAGRQRDARGWTLHAEGGGLFSVGRRGGTLRVGGGGAGRLSAGRALAPAWHLRFGVEAGGAALVDRQLRADDVTVDFLFAAPAALRRSSGLWVADLEVSPVVLGIPWAEAPSRWGGRVAALLGFSALRVRGVLPWTGLALMVEGIAPRRDEPWIWSLRAGVRIGFSLDPSQD